MFYLTLELKSRAKKNLFAIHNYMTAVNSRCFPWAFCLILFLPTSNYKKPSLKPVMFKTTTDLYQLIIIMQLYRLYSFPS